MQLKRNKQETRVCFFVDSSLKLLSEMVRSSDIVACCNTEKFLVVLPMADIGSTTYVAQRIQKTFKQYNFLTSIGVSSISDGDMDSSENLISNAETALNRAIEKGEDTLYLWRDLT